MTTLLRRYLLGQASPDELDEIERRYCETSEHADEYAEAELALWLDYDQGRLTPEERRQFEEWRGASLAAPASASRLVVMPSARQSEAAPIPAVAATGAETGRGGGTKLLPWLLMAASVAAVLGVQFFLVTRLNQGAEETRLAANEQRRSLEQLAEQARQIDARIQAIEQRPLPPTPTPPTIPPATDARTADVPRLLAVAPAGRSAASYPIEIGDGDGRPVLLVRVAGARDTVYTVSLFSEGLGGRQQLLVQRQTVKPVDIGAKADEPELLLVVTTPPGLLKVNGVYRLKWEPRPPPSAAAGEVRFKVMPTPR
jgi:hypothetical protein